MPAPVSTTAYRYPGEILVLLVTISVVFGVIALMATVTVCVSLVFVLGVVLLSYSATRRHHQDLLNRAQQVTPQTAPNLARQASICLKRLQPGEVQIFLVPSRRLNAYTFGLSSPKGVVLYSALVQVMDADEIRFILGHELGHVRLGHTWLNSLIGGMAGIPSTLFINTLLALVFRGWNRTCEYSADRAGLLACGSLDKAVSAMVKLVTPDRDLTSHELENALQRLDREDDDPLNLLGEIFSTHPLLIKRIARLRQYAATPAYRRLQALVDANLA
ncbi:MAG: M48 family metallopeptidase [Anaerolineales bacterium]|jgi:Zn-dependent protease with chaperone function